MRTTSAHRPALRRRGFALIDAIIGGMLLAIGLATIVSIGSRSLRAQTTGEKQLVASWLADEMLNMVLVEGPDKYRQRYSLDGVFEEPFEEFSYVMSIDTFGDHQPFDVSIDVFWPGGSITVDTVLALREGEDRELQPREPLERIDRFERYFGEDAERPDDEEGEDDDG